MNSYRYVLTRKVREIFEVEILSDYRPRKEEIAKAVENACDPHTVELISETVKLKEIVPLKESE